MSERYSKEWIERLLDGSRFAGVDPRDVLAAHGIGAGHTIVDYGCGPGYLTLAAAELAGPSGKVYAVDKEPSMVELVRERCVGAGLSNVEAVSNGGSNAPLPDAVADFVLCFLVLHYPDTDEGREAIARDIARLLKPGGQAVIIQWKAEQRRTSGITYEALAGILETAGLAADGPYDISDEHYKAIAHKPQGNEGPRGDGQ